MKAATPQAMRAEIRRLRRQVAQLERRAKDCAPLLDSATEFVSLCPRGPIDLVFLPSVAVAFADMREANEDWQKAQLAEAGVAS